MKIKTIILGTLIGTLISFFWGAAEWVLPIMHSPYEEVHNASEVNKTLSKNMPENGIYVWPNGDHTKDATGLPKDIVYFIAKNENSFYNPGKFMSFQIFTLLATWLIIVYLLVSLRITKYWLRIRFILILGLLNGLAFHLPMWNWWGFSTDYTLLRWGSMMIGWFLSGITISFFLRNRIIIENPM